MVIRKLLVVFCVLSLLIFATPAQQQTPPRPRPQAMPPASQQVDGRTSLETIMKFIQDEINTIGPINVIYFGHDATTGQEWTNQLRDEVSKVEAQPASCMVSYNEKIIMNGKAGNDTRAEISLKSVDSIIVKTGEKAMNENLSKGGHPSQTVRVDPQVFAIEVVNSPGGYNYVSFLSEDLANRVAKAMVRAVELCRGTSPRTTDLTTTASNASVQSAARPTAAASQSEQNSSTSNSKSIEHFNRGAQFLNTNDYMHAAEEFQAATKANPGNIDAYYYLGVALLEKMTLDASGRVKAYPGTALAFQTYLALQPNGVHNTDARKMLVTMAAPTSSPEAVARANEIRTKSPTQTTAGPPTATSAKNRTPAVPQAFQNGVHWSSTPIPESMTVAFSFSERCLRDECGDGAWGASINRDSNAAIQGAQDACLSKTARHGCNTGGRYFIQCKPEDGPKWAALAIYDDQMEKLSDGEAMGYDTQSAAEQWAISNCHLSGCTAVWSQLICGNDQALQHGSCGASQKGALLDWTGSIDTYNANDVVSGEKDSRTHIPTTVKLTDSGISIHVVDPSFAVPRQTEVVIPFSVIGEVKVTGFPSQQGFKKWSLTISPAAPWPTGFFETRSNVGNARASSWHITFLTEAAAQQALEFFEYHRCVGK
jgi:hypothetical protein